MSEQNPQDNDNTVLNDDEPLLKKIRADKRRRTREELWKELRRELYPHWEHMCDDLRETLETNFEVNYFIALGTNKSIPSTATRDTNDPSENIDFAEPSTSGSSSNAGTSSEAGTSSNIGVTNFADSDSGTSSSGIGSESNSDSFHNSSDLGEANVSSCDEPSTSGTTSSNEAISYSRANSPDAESDNVEAESVDMTKPSTSRGASSNRNRSRRSRNHTSALRSRVSHSLIALLRATPINQGPGRKPHRPFQGGVLQPLSNLGNCYTAPSNPLPSFSSFQRGGMFDPQPSTSRSQQPPPLRPIPSTSSSGAAVNNDDDNNNTDEIDPFQLAIQESFRF